jgi:hypothetical protein
VPGFGELVITYGPFGGLFIFYTWQIWLWWSGKQSASKSERIREEDKPATKGDLDELRSEFFKELDVTRGAVYDVGKAVATVHSVASEVRGIVTGMKR